MRVSPRLLSRIHLAPTLSRGTFRRRTVHPSNVARLDAEVPMMVSRAFDNHPWISTAGSGRYHVLTLETPTANEASDILAEDHEVEVAVRNDTTLVVDVPHITSLEEVHRGLAAIATVVRGPRGPPPYVEDAEPLPVEYYAVPFCIMHGPMPVPITAIPDEEACLWG